MAPVRNDARSLRIRFAHCFREGLATTPYRREPFCSYLFQECTKTQRHRFRVCCALAPLDPQQPMKAAPIMVPRGPEDVTQLITYNGICVNKQGLRNSHEDRRLSIYPAFHRPALFLNLVKRLPSLLPHPKSPSQPSVAHPTAPNSCGSRPIWRRRFDLARGRWNGTLRNCPGLS